MVEQLTDAYIRLAGAVLKSGRYDREFWRIDNPNFRWWCEVIGADPDYVIAEGRRHDPEIYRAWDEEDRRADQRHPS